MSVSRKLDSNLDDLPVDTFDAVKETLRVESLTAGHGIAEPSGFCVLCYAPACNQPPTPSLEESSVAIQ